MLTKTSACLELFYLWSYLFCAFLFFRINSNLLRPWGKSHLATIAPVPVTLRLRDCESKEDEAPHESEVNTPGVTTTSSCNTSSRSESDKSMRLQKVNINDMKLHSAAPSASSTPAPSTAVSRKTQRYEMVQTFFYMF